MTMQPLPPGYRYPPNLMPWYDPTVTNLPTVEIADSYNPRYGEQTEPTPIPGDPGMSVPMSPTAKTTQKKKRGLLSSVGKILGDVFMPEPDSLYAAALRGGIWDAKANQRAYQQQEQMNDLDLREANAKLQNLLKGGEYKVVGNNVIHFPADGGPAEFVTPPAQPGEKERLIDRIQKGDPMGDLIERVLLGGNSDEALQSREEIAGTRAGATTESARIRAAASGGKGKGGASGGYEYKIINGKLMRRPK